MNNAIFIVHECAPKSFDAAKCIEWFAFQGFFDL